MGFLYKKICNLLTGIFASLLTTLLATAMFSSPAYAATIQKNLLQAQLGLVKPLIACATLADADLAGVTGAAVSLKASLITTAKGEFCQVKGNIAPSIGFEVDLPVTKWTQRYLQAGCGGLCGDINASIGNAASCLPALDGQFVVAASDLGHQGSMMSPSAGDFGKEPQKLIDFAYRANHLTALAAKELIRIYYGQAARYAYFSGCSDGGREALMEAQRYPDDFDGISAGAPAMLFTVQNSFWHAWTTAANLDEQGKTILYADKLPLLHAAVIAHCDMLDGNRDGLLSDPRACKIQPSWIVCQAGSTDTSNCLTQSEWSVAERLYAGPRDAEGKHFLPGGSQPGSELQWDFIQPRPNPKAPQADNGFAGKMLENMSHLIYTTPTADESHANQFPFTMTQLARVSRWHGLLDASNPDLSAFSSRGGKLLMWHGWSDNSIAPMVSIAYYQAVQNQLSKQTAERFIKLFMLPGVGHCGGGDGFAQVDTLTPLMNWVESGHAPTAIRAGKIADRRMGPPPGENMQPGSANGPDGRGMQMRRAPAPYAAAPEPTLATRPIFAFPFIATYKGAGDPNRAENYRVKSGTTVPSIDKWPQQLLMQAGFQKTYIERNGGLIEENK